ncbi:hypothetical protein CVT25_010958 [Psilocybe cyanescens]|uniref:Mid2 domain-containing protein n=1 Tax=Psilocybe cyanescens TaxID=93625 RepID=A0A409WFU5_PSICY|nr:hypothetical protein CVT25_010958 [Psilocybe cyanescens]
MDARALIGVQERQVLGLPGLSDVTSSSASTSASESSTSASSTSSSVSSTSTEATSTSSTSDVITSTSQELSTTTSQSTQTVIAFPADSSSSSSATPSAVAHTSFLQNKVLSGLVFALAGVVGLVVIVSILTFVIRRKRTRRLVEDAVSFDPVKMGAGYHNALEAGHSPQSNYVRSSTSTGRASNGPEVRQTPAFADYAPPPPPSQMYMSSSASVASYHSQQGYNNSQQQQAAYQQPFNWAAPPQQVDPYKGTRGSAESA